MLETIRQFAGERLVESGDADHARTAHARYFADCEARVMALWDSPRQREAYEWFTVELANLRAAFRWAADKGDLDVAAAIAVYGPFLGAWVDQFEPVAWAEALIKQAEAVQHQRLAQLYVMASQSYITTWKAEEAVRHAERAQSAIASGRFDPVMWEFDTWVGGVYAVDGHPGRWTDMCQRIIAREPGPHMATRACLSISLYVGGDADGARRASQPLLAAADQTDNPRLACISLLAFGVAHLESDPDTAYEALRRGLKIAQQSGNSTFESHLALALGRHAVARGDLLDALQYIALTIGNYYDSGSFSLMANPLATLAAVFDELGRYETAATIIGFATTPLTRSLRELGTADTHLRVVLGEDAYQSLTDSGKAKTNAGMAGYALEAIDHARAVLRSDLR